MPALALYPLLFDWLRAFLGPVHHATHPALTHLLTALLVAQSLRPARLMRALWSPTPVPARQRYQRTARLLDRPWLTPAWLTPRLVRATTTLFPACPGQPTVLALDSVRAGGWELFTLALVHQGRAFLLAWAVLPYPWPKKTFTPTVCQLLREVAAVWPADRPVELVADRAFPSAAFFRTLQAVGWAWTVRLRAVCGVEIDGQPCAVRDLLARASQSGWTSLAAGFGRGTTAIAGTLVIGRGLLVLPGHQTGPASLRARVARAARRLKQVTSKHPGKPDRSAETDGWVVLFTCRTRARAATRVYRQRWSIEGSYRDAQGGWDGQQGWDWEARVQRLKTATAVEQLAGLWALGALVQGWLGTQTLAPSGPVAKVVAGWTTTGRLSVWARGKLAEPQPAMWDWVGARLAAGARQLEEARTATRPRLLPIARAPVRRAA